MSAETDACQAARSIQKLLRQGKVSMRSDRQAADDVAALFHRLGLKVSEQHELGPKARPTFFLAASGLAIEVASARTPTALAHQRLRRCAEHEDVHAVLLVAPFLGDLAQTVDIAGKPAFFAQIGRAA